MAGFDAAWSWAKSLKPLLAPAELIVMPFLLAVSAIYWLTKSNLLRRADCSATMSPDTVSALFPDRPIRPLPKRRLREKLSPEAAETIRYPPSAHKSVPLFQYPPYSVKDEEPTPRARSASPTEQSRGSGHSQDYAARTNGIGCSGKDEGDVDSRNGLVTRLYPDMFTQSAGRPGGQEEPRRINPQPPPSTDSSVDGYDSFENTNNKKKRKIPSAGDSVLSSAHGLGADINPHAPPGGAGMGEVGADRLHNGAGYAGSASLGSGSSGISGPGRGRLGRSRNGRSPLRALSDGSNNWAGKPPRGSTSHWASSGTFAL